MPTILVPLYIYPAPGAWEPLYKAITTHPGTTFLTVINPGSGPGPEALPDANYLREIPKLNTYSNVKTLGYVSTAYTKRDLELVQKDIRTYSAWQTQAVQGLSVKGIFFDETPSQWDAQTAEFLRLAHREAREAKGFGESILIVSNPGTVPDTRLLGGPDVTVVFEGKYETYQIYGINHAIRQLASKADREASAAATASDTARVVPAKSKFACILHSVPEDIAGSQSALQRLVKDLQATVTTAYITDLDENVYAGFGSCWLPFVELLG